MSGLQKNISLTGIERPWGTEEVIVSKTNLKGHITYANDVFRRVSLMKESDLLGKPHNIIRHPFMPRCIYRLLWDTVQDKRELFAYVVNRAANGDHYWVFAHVTPSLDANGTIVGYHSNRRKPNPDQIDKVKSLYTELNAIEDKIASPKESVNASYDRLHAIVNGTGASYDEFIFSL